jgi:hypothetical protein
VSWPPDPAELLDAPSGRRLCWEVLRVQDARAEVLTGPAWELVHGARRDPVALAAEITRAILAADLPAVAAATAETILLGPLMEVVDCACYWGGNAGREEVLGSPEVARALLPVAEAVIAAPGQRWWGEPVDPARQRYVEPWGEARVPPELTGSAAKLAEWREETIDDERCAAERPSDPTANWGGHWWSSPALSGLVSTTRALPGLGSVQLMLTEDSFGWTDEVCWPLAPKAGARVLEITGPGDWTALVGRYPLDISKSRRHDWYRVTGWTGAWLMPDYAAAAADYDAIHLSVAGYLAAAGVGLEIGEARTMLAGWDPDETYWLADVLVPDGPPTRWVDQGDSRSEWAPAASTERPVIWRRGDPEPR